MVHCIFSFLTVEELSLLSICSKGLRDAIVCFQNTSQGRARILPCLTPMETPAEIARFQELGIFIKRSTCLYPTKDRLKIMMELINRMEVRPTPSSTALPHLLRCYGRFIHTVIAGWDDCECALVHIVLEKVSRMDKLLHEILSSNPGTDETQETYVRRYYRLVYLDDSLKTSDRAFWLSLILRPLPLVNQAKLLYLLFGPTATATGQVLWWELTEAGLTNPEPLRELSGALRMLRKNNRTSPWSDDDITSIIHEITDYPEAWNWTNRAFLLYLTGQSISLLYVGSKLLNGKIAESADYVANWVLVSYRINGNIRWALRMLKRLLELTTSSSDTLKFLMTIPASLRSIAIDLYEIIFVDEDREMDMRIFLSAQESLLSALLRSAYNSGSSIFNDSEE